MHVSGEAGRCDRLYMKRSRARVPIAGQCILLQNSLRIEMFDFFKYPKLPYESHLYRHTSETLKKIVKMIETRPQSSKKTPKWQTFVEFIM